MHAYETPPSASLNRVRIMDLPGLPLDPAVQGQRGDELLSSRALMAFAEKNGKVPITVKDFPGFAINPVFIAAYLVLDSFYGEAANAATLVVGSETDLADDAEVMGDEQQCFYMTQDKFFHPYDGVDVQMVGGFIQ